MFKVGLWGWGLAINSTFRHICHPMELFHGGAYFDNKTWHFYDLWTPACRVTVSFFESMRRLDRSCSYHVFERSHGTGASLRNTENERNVSSVKGSGFWGFALLYLS